MEFNNRYAALDPAALKALAKLRGGVTNGNEGIALEGLVAQDKQKGLEVRPASNDKVEHAFHDAVEHASHDMGAVATGQGSNREGDGHETTKKKRRRGKKGGVKSKKKGNGTVATGERATGATGHMKAADIPSTTEEAQAGVLSTSSDKEPEATEQKLLEAPQDNMGTFGGIVKGYPGAAMVTIIVVLFSVITFGLTWCVS
jgi:hypothetical protein